MGSVRLNARSSWDAEVELVAMVVGSTVSVGSAVNTVALSSGSSWDAEVELVAVVVGSAVSVRGAANTVRGLFHYARAPLIALITFRAFAFGKLARTSCGWWHDFAVSDTEAKLIALIASRASATLATSASLVRLIVVGSSNAEAKLIAVLSSRARTSLSALAGAVGGQRSAGNTEAELVAVVSTGASASLSALAC